MLKIAAFIVALFLAFVVWRWTSVSRGAKQRDEKLLERLDPIGKRFDAGEAVSREEIGALAARPENRYVLYPVLRHMNKADLLPAEYNSSVSQGEAALAYWLMHPNEAQDAPETIEHVETLTRPINGQDAEFHVYRYRMPAGHWAAKDGWLLGLAGPMNPSAEPYAELPGAFSRMNDTVDKVRPAELVDWWVDMMKQKGMTK
jgi:hypothetical protein